MFPPTFDTGVGLEAVTKMDVFFFFYNTSHPSRRTYILLACSDTAPNPADFSSGPFLARNVGEHGVGRPGNYCHQVRDRRLKQTMCPSSAFTADKSPERDPQRNRGRAEVIFVSGKGPIVLSLEYAKGILWLMPKESECLYGRRPIVTVPKASNIILPIVF